MNKHLFALSVLLSAGATCYAGEFMPEVIKDKLGIVVWDENNTMASEKDKIISAVWARGGYVSPSFYFALTANQNESVWQCQHAHFTNEDRRAYQELVKTIRSE